MALSEDEEFELLTLERSRSVSGNKSDRIPQGYAPTPKPAPSFPGSDFMGTMEAGLGAATGAIGGLVGNVAGIGSTLLSGKYGTQEGIRAGQDTAGRVASAMTYQPRTELGQERLQQLGEVIGASKIAGLGPAEGMAIAGRMGAQLPIPTPRIPMRAKPEAAAIVGGGAAMTPMDRLRYERMQSLPVPMNPTKAILSRDFQDQRWERETAKDGKLGAPIRERYDDLNQQLTQNFDAIADATGAEMKGLRATGEIVNDAVVSKAKKAKAEINAEYEKAAKAGEMAQEVPYTKVTAYLNDQTPTVKEKLAPIIKAVEEQIAKNDPESKGTIPINALEDVRKLINRNVKPGTPDQAHGIEIKKLIDESTEGAGGDIYKNARALRTRYAQEFKNVGVIDKMMRTKPGTTDRAVAFEDVFKHSMLNGSLDDVRAVWKTLQTAGPKGEQAWRELQGQTIQELKRAAVEKSATDARGNPIVSSYRLNNLVVELDRDNRLDFIFGKKVAQQIRDVNEAAKDVKTFPPGSVNTSNTASVMLDAIGNAMLGRLPTATRMAVGGFNKFRASRATEKRVQEHLNPVEPRESGGPVTAGKPYLVGERGPELVVPSKNATVIPTGTLAALAMQMKQQGPAWAKTENAYDLVQLARLLKQ